VEKALQIPVANL